LLVAMEVNKSVMRTAVMRLKPIAEVIKFRVTLKAATFLFCLQA
jgi:hypothetical protein